MKKHTLRGTRRIFAGILALVLTWRFAEIPARAADVLSLMEEAEESQICPMEDGSGMYLMKSDGFYCIGADGSKDGVPAVHYFEHTVIDGTVFHGYYYHGADGKFHAGDSRMVYLEPITCRNMVFEGFYMTGNLGKLTAAPQVRYLENLTVNRVLFQGYYFFNEYGRLVREPGIHTLEMDENGRQFRGSYYFGGINGALCEEAGTTPDGFPYDAQGRVEIQEGRRMEALQSELNNMVSEYDGEWSIYVKNLDTDESFEINSRPMTSASLIKTFVMEKTYEDLDSVRENEAARIEAPPGSGVAADRVDELLWNMITASDNESCNELVRLQTPSFDFGEGARSINEYLLAEGYEDTSVQHTLHPSSSQEEGLGGNNTTSVADCGKILEKIYRGTCVSGQASQEMLNLLLNQQTTWKIPAGVSGDAAIANKTGETDHNQHDIAIIYGPAVRYILCVMSEDCADEGDAIDGIQKISGTVYKYLNVYEYSGASGQESAEASPEE